MAEEEEEGGEAGGSVLKKYGPLAAVVLLVQVVLAWVMIKVALPDGGAEGDEEERLETVYVQVEQQDAEDNSLPYQYQPEALLNITANPAGTNMERYIVIDAALGLTGSNEENEKLGAEAMVAAVTKVDDSMPLIKQVITSIISRQTVDQLEGEAFEEVRKAIRKRLNEEIFNSLFTMGQDKMVIEVQDFIVSRKVVQ